MEEEADTMRNGINILDKEGNPTTLKAGNCIGYISQYNFLVLIPEQGSPSSMYWADGDDKKIADFVRNEDSFRDFVYIIAELSGLQVKKMYRTRRGPVYEFV